jgi:two-component system OmpR family response regulator/two-component system response regulator QseB
VRWQGRNVDLPRREFALLRVLMENPGRTVSRESAQLRVFGWDEDVASNTLDVHVHHLRRKLPAALIRTVRGIGYALDEAVAQAPPEAAP